MQDKQITRLSTFLQDTREVPFFQDMENEGLGDWITMGNPRENVLRLQTLQKI